MLSHPLAVVSNGVLAPEGPAYKALIVDHVHALSPAGMKRLADYGRFADCPVWQCHKRFEECENGRFRGSPFRGVERA